MVGKIIKDPIVWAYLNVLGAGFVANAPSDLSWLWLAKWAAAVFAGGLMIALHPPAGEIK